jgi:GTP-binding protein HflX
MSQRSDRSRHHQDRPSRAILLAVQLPQQSDADVIGSLSELERLAAGLGIHVIETTVQKRAVLTSPTLVGEGKIRDLAQLTGGPGPSVLAPRGAAGASVFDRSAAEPAADMVLVDAELTPAQQRNLELSLGADVLDRTAIILRVFERRAQTRAARLEVELARLTYETPRIRDDASLGDREGGGGRGGRGHTNVELAKQRHRKRIAELRQELEEVRAVQETRRERRKDRLRVALVGYTNAGKSSLMKALTGSDVLVEDKLFATLGTTLRVLRPETTPPVLVVDTVGFLENLPHALIASFRSTLDEVHDASLLLLVADATAPALHAQLDVTRRVVDELGASSIPSMLLLNKIDQVSPEDREQLATAFPAAIQMCAHDPSDAQRLRETILACLDRQLVTESLDIPYQASGILAELRRDVQVLSEEYGATGSIATIRALPAAIARLRHRLVEHAAGLKSRNP